MVEIAYQMAGTVFVLDLRCLCSLACTKRKLQRGKLFGVLGSHQLPEDPSESSVQTGVASLSCWQELVRHYALTWLLNVAPGILAYGLCPGELRRCPR